MLTVTLLALTLLTGAADALDEGQRRLEAGDFEGALQVLDAAAKQERSGPRIARLQLARARCLAALKKSLELDTALELAFEADPTLALEADVSPGFRATFERVRARLAGTLTIETEPPGATVRINGALIGASPVTEVLPVGAYAVSALDSAGTEAVSRSVVVGPRQKQTVVLVVQAVAAPVAAPAPTKPEVIAEPAPAPLRRPWPVEPAFMVRLNADVPRGVAFEVGGVLLGRFWLVEAAVLRGDGWGVGGRVGGRVGFYDDLLGVQLTADVAIFLRQPIAPGFGGTVSFVFHPLSFLDLLVDAGARLFPPRPDFHAQYFLVGASLRLRLPTGLDGRM